MPHPPTPRSNVWSDELKTALIKRVASRELGAWAQSCIWAVACWPMPLVALPGWCTVAWGRGMGARTYSPWPLLFSSGVAVGPARRNVQRGTGKMGRHVHLLTPHHGHQKNGQACAPPHSSPWPSPFSTGIAEEDMEARLQQLAVLLPGLVPRLLQVCY